MGTRRHLAVAALALLVVSSGCIGVLTGSEALTFEADAATTDESTASEAGYENNGTRTQTIEREFSVAGQSRTVEATNKITTYEKEVEIPVLGSAKVGVFSVISSPAAEVAGQTFNPIGDYSNDRLVQLIASNYGGLEDVERVGDQQLSVLGSETTVSKYSATASFQGQEIDVFAHVTKVRSGDDFVVAVGVYPQRLDGEESNVLSMIRAIDHSA